MGCGASNQAGSGQSHKVTYRHKRTKLIDSRRQSTRLVDNILQNVTIINESLSQQQQIFLRKCLNNHQLFNSLSQEELIKISTSVVLATSQINSYVFQQGQTGNSFFLIYQGQVSVQVDGVYVRTLKAGDSFGQLALLFRTQRTATIKIATDNTLLFILKPASFRETLKKIKTLQLYKGKKMIDHVQIFQGLSNKQKDLLNQNLKLIKFKSGQIIFRKGYPAKAFYIIMQGQVLIQIQNKEPIILTNFDCFGENAFQENSFRAGNAKSQSDCSCYFLLKQDLDEVFGKSVDKIFYYNLKKWALVRSPSFKLDSKSLNLLISKFQLKRAKQGQILVQSKPSGLIINLNGKMNNKPAGTLFCENNFLDRSAICNPIIKNQAGEYAFLSFTELDNLMNYIQERKNIGYSKKTIPDKQNVQTFDISTFQFLKQLGQGQFGKVYLVRNKCLGGQLYAIKCLSKAAIKKQSMENCVVQQKRILSKIIFPYIVGFVKSFHDEKNIYFLIEYIKGKQMFDVIRQMPFLNQTIATYYFGCLLLSIQHLHQNNVIYRDLKPQNSVVDYNGKAFLIDLGTAKFLKKQTFYKTFTLIGTPHYMAPQIFDAKGYSFEVDIWSLGILLYQLTCGKLPFGEHQNDPYKVMKKVKNDEVDYPSSVSSELKQTLDLLLQKNFKVRSIRADFQTIKRQKYFNNINWIDLLKQKVKPPYIPKDYRRQKLHENTMKMSGKALSEYLYPLKGGQKQAKKWEVREWNQQFNK